MRRLLIGVAAAAAAGLLGRGASAQAGPGRPAATTPLGVWRGTSLCLVRPSPCHDEIVVYRITPLKAADSVAVDARKIVRGEEEEMGVLACRLLPPTGELACALPQGVWRFTARGDSLVGELRLPDGTKFRDVRAARAP